MRDKPVRDWAYRGIECRLYKHTTPEGFELAGYAEVGDEWFEVVDDEEIDEEEAIDKVKDWVDTVIMQVKLEEEQDDLTSPLPGPSPTNPPNPDPNPWVPNPQPQPIDPGGPIWIGDDDTITTSETFYVKV